MGSSSKLRRAIQVERGKTSDGSSCECASRHAHSQLEPSLVFPRSPWIALRSLELEPIYLTCQDLVKARAFRESRSKKVPALGTLLQRCMGSRRKARYAFRSAPGSRAGATPIVLCRDDGLRPTRPWLLSCEPRPPWPAAGACRARGCGRLCRAGCGGSTA